MKLTRKQVKENNRRAQRARNIMDAYCVETGAANKDDAPLCDLIADIMHMCAADCEVDEFDDALASARMHFNAECNGEP